MPNPFLLTIIFFLVLKKYSACKCVEAEVVDSYSKQSDVFLVTIENEVKDKSTESYVVFEAKIKEVFKGCQSVGNKVYLRTATSSAACGLLLERSSGFVVATSPIEETKSFTYFPVYSCGYNKPLTSVTPEDLSYLRSRSNCCSIKNVKVCSCTNKKQPVQCLVSPCSVSSCDFPDATCSDNYCNGCNAEWTAVIPPFGLIQPVCQSCLMNGKTYKNGESFKLDCNTCSCSNGAVVCTKMACLRPPPTPKPTRKPVPRPARTPTKTPKVKV